MSAPLWTFDDMVRAMKGRPLGAHPAAIAGISIDSRTILPGEAFFAIRGDSFDGHDFAGRALAAGAATAVVSEARLSSLGKVSGSLVVVDDVLGALERLGRASRARSAAQDRRGHRQRRQDRHQGDARPRARGRRRGALLAGLVQQPLGRAADPGAHAARRRASASSRSA